MSTLKIEEKVAVKAQPERVFQFLIDPERVVRCLPGAGYDGKEADDTFLGHIKVKVGAVTTNFHGKARMEDLDPAARRVRIIGEGKDRAGGGSAKLVMLGSVDAIADGGSELKVQADVEIAGRLVSFGRGMIQSVSAQLFKQFSERIRAALEVSEPTPPSGALVVPAATPPTPQKEEEALSVLPLIFRAVWQSIARFFRRLFGRREQ